MLRRTGLSSSRSRAHWAINSSNGWGFDDNPHHNMCRTQKDLRIDEFAEWWMMNHQQKYIKENTEVASGAVRQVEIPHWQQQTRPTHFLSLRVPANTLLQSHVESLRFITERDMKHYAPLLVPSSKIHVTLSVLTFHESEEVLVPKVERIVQRAFKQLSRPPQKQQAHEGAINLRFNGMGTFGQGRVVFARVQSDYGSTRLAEVVSTIRRGLANVEGIEVKGNPHDSYTPHATLAKVSSKAAKQVATLNTSAKPGTKLLETVPRELYDPHANDDFGLVQFKTLDLCSMKGEAADGYYRTLSRHRLAAA